MIARYGGGSCVDRADQRRCRRGLARLLVVVAGVGLLIGPASAQNATHAFCSTQMAQTVRNVFTVVQLAGPLLGGVLAIGTTVMLPVVGRVDFKKELKETRNNALIWGVIVAPLGAEILAFIMNSIVAGGSSCAF